MAAVSIAGISGDLSPGRGGYPVAYRLRIMGKIVPVSSRFVQRILRKSLSLLTPFIIS